MQALLIGGVGHLKFIDVDLDPKYIGLPVHPSAVPVERKNKDPNSQFFHHETYIKMGSADNGILVYMFRDDFNKLYNCNKGGIE